MKLIFNIVKWKFGDGPSTASMGPVGCPVARAFLVVLLLSLGCDLAERERAAERARAEAEAARAAAEAEYAQAEAEAQARAAAEEAARSGAAPEDQSSMACDGVPFPEELRGCETSDECKVYYSSCRVLAGRKDLHEAVGRVIAQCHWTTADDCLGVGFWNAVCRDGRCEPVEAW